jgi:hypothetical protein
MTPDRLRQCLNLMGWSNRHLALMLDRPESTVRQWLAGAVQVPVDTAEWLEARACQAATTQPPGVDISAAAATLRDLMHAGLVGPTGHAPAREYNNVMAAAAPGERLAIVETDAAGYPLMDEPWNAVRYPDGSALIVTHVRGRDTVDFWKAVDTLRGFDVVRAGVAS